MALCVTGGLNFVTVALCGYFPYCLTLHTNIFTCTFANNADPDETARNQDLHCLPFCS